MDPSRGGGKTDLSKKRKRFQNVFFSGKLDVAMSTLLARGK